MATIPETIIVDVQAFTINSDTYEGLRGFGVRGNPQPRRAQRNEGAMRPTSFVALPTDRPKYTASATHTSAEIHALMGTSSATATITGRDAAGATKTITLTNPFIRNVTLPNANNQEAEQTGTIEIDATEYAIA